MSVETALFTALTEDVTGAGLWSDRVYPGVTPDDVVFPAVAYALEGSELIASGGQYESRLIVDCYDHHYDLTRDMKDAVLGIADDEGWSANVGADEFEDDSKLHHIAVELLIVHI